MVKSNKLLELREVSYVDEQYSVIYQSKQSYYVKLYGGIFPARLYDLFDSAEISWKRSQKVSPKLDPELVKKTNRNPRVFSSKPKGD